MNKKLLITDIYDTSFLRLALEKHQFEIWYQPLFNHASGALIGAEALIRWRHPQMGLLLPEHFIPVFEKNGFIYELDQYVWEQVCIFLNEHYISGNRLLPITVNISKYCLLQANIVKIFMELIKKYEIPAQLLHLDIAESVFVKASAKLKNTVKTLRENGFIVQIDNFGGACSSLNVIRDIPTDGVKLDMKFLSDAEVFERAGTLAETIVKMCRQLGMSAIAEGVEKIEQVEFLKSIGCYDIQGYLYAWPQTENAYEKMFLECVQDSDTGESEKTEQVSDENSITPCAVSTDGTDILEYLHELMENIPCGAGIYKYEKGKIKGIFLNARYWELVGRDPYDLEGKDIFQHVQLEDRAYLLKILQNSLIDNGRMECDVHVMHGSGKYKPFHLKGNIVKRKRGEVMIYVTYTPISEDEISFRKMIPVALEAMMASSTDLSFT